ncbi:hypothetical protein CK203_060718 [Vitis vinifera]|uniref:PGG domain-containing protein n=1 Tax=Vitis vinifera TaxID=29760 RepID=A0A438GCA9_VITVI|nr:hypothetical protein CK203_060718 [Vitis vinifera]
MIVAALIGTVTFATGFTLPGDCIQDKGNNQGMAVLSFPTNGTMDHNGLMATTNCKNTLLSCLLYGYMLTMAEMIATVIAFVDSPRVVLHHS